MPFKDWLPDLSPLANPGLTVASGVLPTADGYGPFPDWVSLGVAALTGFARGASAGLDPSGVGYNFTGDATTLYRIGPAGFQDVTRLAGAYNANGTARWDFLQTRDRMLACNPYDDIQTLDLADVNGTFTQLSPDAPRARFLAFIGPQMIAANIFDPIAGQLPDGFRYPQINNPSSWPDPAGDLAAQAQAGLTVIEGNGGRIQAAVSGAEVGAIFQERQIARVEYVGGDVIYQTDRVEKTRGCLIPGLAVPLGREIFYCSEDGFYLFNYTSSESVGDSKVNRTFLADVDANYFHRVSAILHPDLPIVAVGYPGAGNVGGTPNRILVYNHALRKFATVDLEHDLLARVVPLGVTMDNLGFPNLDTVPMSLDEFVSSPGAQQFGAYSTAHLLGTFSGEAVAATLETGDRELLPGRICWANAARPLVDDAEPTVQVSRSFDRRSSAADFRPAAALNRYGTCPIRALGRYHRFRLNVPAGWTGKAVGLDVEFERDGSG
mgnify:CR=1 FL=1